VKNGKIMAKETSPQDQPPVAPPPAPAKVESGLSMQKLIMIGVPMFIVQLVLVYFIAVKFIGGKSEAASNEKAAETEAAATAESEQSNLYIVKDVIINPAGTNGGRFLLTTVGIEVTTPEAQKELDKKELQVRDILNSILTSKTISELVDVSQRETLRGEIAKSVGALLKSGKMKNVYFSKYIIQ
jgi:flagellar FliL protein